MYQVSQIWTSFTKSHNYAKKSKLKCQLRKKLKLRKIIQCQNYEIKSIMTNFFMTLTFCLIILTFCFMIQNLTFDDFSLFVKILMSFSHNSALFHNYDFMVPYYELKFIIHYFKYLFQKYFCIIFCFFIENCQVFIFYCLVWLKRTTIQM